MRVRELAKALGIPHNTLLERIRRDTPLIPVDSVMSRLTEPDIDKVIVALATQNPRYDLEGTDFEKQAKSALLSYKKVKSARERMGARREEVQRLEANRLPEFGDQDLLPAQSWSAFMRAIHEMDQSDQSEPKRGRRQLLKTEDLLCSLCAEQGEFAKVMARRRLMTASVGQSCRKFHYELIEDVALLKLDKKSHEAICRADSDVISQLQAATGVCFPAQIDWAYAEAYILRDIHHDAFEVKTGLTREQVATQLQGQDTLAEEIATMHGFEELDDAQFALINSWIQGDVPVNYDALRALMDEDYITYSAALAIDLHHAEQVMVETTLDHIFGKGEEAVSVRLNNENENTRYRFMLYAGQGGVASVVVSFEL